MELLRQELHSTVMNADDLLRDDSPLVDYVDIANALDDALLQLKSWAFEMGLDFGFAILEPNAVRQSIACLGRIQDCLHALQIKPNVM